MLSTPRASFMNTASIDSTASPGRSLSCFVLVLFGLCVPVWVIGAMVDIEIFPGFKLFQAGLAMPMIAAFLLTYRERGWAGVVALLRRTVDVGSISPRLWFLPILLVYPSFGFINYWLMRQSGADVPPPTFSLVALLGYCTVFFMTYAEELGLTGYLTDRMQQRYSALTTGVLLGLVWAGYHIPGFVISGYYTAWWISWHAVYTVAARVLFVWIYNNSGRSLFSMALCHWAFGLFWIFWPQDNLQKAVPFYRPQITAAAAVVYVTIVVFLWGPETLARFRFLGQLHTWTGGIRRG
jgi:membrane protease YdiL (CAAX protease family)